jgi:hypothetical protein
MRFLRRSLFIVAMVVVALSVSPALAGLVVPDAFGSIDGVEYDIPVEFDPFEGGYIVGPASSTSGGDRVTNVVGFYESDPRFDYTLSVIDSGAPSVFSFTFYLPLSPPFRKVRSIDASIVGSMTDAETNTVSITPVIVDLDSDGADEVQVGLAESYATPPAGSHTDLYGMYAASRLGGPNGSVQFTVLKVETSFKGSGGGDAVALTGFVFIVPEPGGLLLAASALIVGGSCCASGRLRRRRAAQ